jgi:hypothetical protein
MSVIDDQERNIAIEIERDHPDWVVMWGCYSRLFWAFPRFSVPKGTIISAPSGAGVLSYMLDLEAEFRNTDRVPRYSSPSPAASLPRRLPLAHRRGQPQWNVPTAVSSAAGTHGPQATESYPTAPLAPPWPEQSNQDLYMSGPVESRPGDQPGFDAFGPYSDLSPDGMIG